MPITVLALFVLGIGNFALHKAVLESDHPMMSQFAPLTRFMGGKLTLVVEFGILVAAMIMVANGWPGLLWGYVIYTALNAVSAWLMLSGRV
ncbi:hypothetical protein [Erythrobacter sp. MTPC3]|uniref:hypothetical protein n=1 Tax=Erythrobacter sp. MTPC3 TaxID=3056564 RepID=UPI0036F2435A